MKTFKLVDGSGSISLKYVVEDVDRHGNVRLYYRVSGKPKIRLKEKPGTKAFLVEYDKARKGLTKPNNRGRTKPRASQTSGTFHWLCCEYFRSAEYKELSERTRYLRKRSLDELCMKFGEKLYMGAGPRVLRKIRDEYVYKPGAADNIVKALRAVFKFAVDDDLLETSPARDLKKFRRKTNGHHTWTVEEIRKFEGTHPIGTAARLAMALFLYTGQRRADVASFGPQHVKDGWLIFTQHKGRDRNPVRLELPILDELLEVINATETGHLSFIVNKRGKPFTIESLGNWFREMCDQAGLPHCSAHGLRKAGAVLAAENGATSQELMALFGWKTLEHVELYTKQANQRRLAEKSMGLISLDQK